MATDPACFLRANSDPRHKAFRPIQAPQDDSKNPATAMQPKTMLKTTILISCSLFPLLGGCTKPDSGAGQSKTVMDQIDSMDIEQKAADAAAEIDESSADQALEDLEKELSGE